MVRAGGIRHWRGGSTRHIYLKLPKNAMTKSGLAMPRSENAGLPAKSQFAKPRANVAAKTDLAPMKILRGARKLSPGLEIFRRADDERAAKIRKLIPTSTLPQELPTAPKYTRA
jgi:hypothetical protein